MPDHEIGLRVSVNGKEVTVEVNINNPLEVIIPKALEKADVKGQPPDRWIVNDAAGNDLSLKQKIADFNFTPGTLLFLNLKAGIGG